jgi:hypothetical protein
MERSAAPGSSSVCGTFRPSPVRMKNARPALVKVADPWACAP